MNIEVLPIGEIVPNPNNSRLHSAAQIADIVKSIREFGWTNPLLVDETGILLPGQSAREWIFRYLMHLQSQIIARCMGRHER